MFVDLATALVSGTILLAVGAGTPAAWRWFRRTTAQRRLDRASQLQIAEAAQRKRATDTARRDRSALEARVVARAQQIGRSVPVRRVSRTTSPQSETLEYSDGGQFTFFAHVDEYQRAARRGDVNPTRASAGSHRPPITEWSNEALERWLGQNADAW